MTRYKTDYEKYKSNKFNSEYSMNNQKPKYEYYIPSEENRVSLEWSASEIKGLKERPLKCPYCDYTIGSIFESTTGHIRLKCSKCKACMVLNPVYFRRTIKGRYTISITFHPPKET